MSGPDVSVDPVEAANARLQELGYTRTSLHVQVAPLPGRVLLKGTRMLSPFADSPEVVLGVVQNHLPPAEQLGRDTIAPRDLRERLEQGGAA